MQKQQIIDALSAAGSVDPEQDYLDNFKGIHYTKHNDVLSAITAQFSEGALRSSEKDNNMTDNTALNTSKNLINESLIDIIVEANGYKMQVVATKGEEHPWGTMCAEGSVAVITCPSCQDGAIPVGEGSGFTAKKAINAFGDWFYFRNKLQTNNKHIEPGLRLNVTKKQFDDLLENEYPFSDAGDLGQVGRRYKGEYFGLKVNSGQWGKINVNFGRFKITRLNLTQDEILKHDFVDALLDGYSIHVNLEKVAWGWISAVAGTLTNPDRDAAWEAYQEKKGIAATKAKAKEAGRKIERKIQNAERDGDTDRAAELREKVEYIYVSINGTAPVLRAFEVGKVKDGVEVPVLQTGTYDVLNTRNAKKFEVNYTGTASSKKVIRDYAAMGYTLR